MNVVSHACMDALISDEITQMCLMCVCVCVFVCVCVCVCMHVLSYARSSLLMSGESKF